jgi:hypothetical protein
MKATENKIEINDIVGNTVQGFKFQVLEVICQLDNFAKMKVQNISTFEIFETTTDRMYKHGTRKY